jgi:hypothetical protein
VSLRRVLGLLVIANVVPGSLVLVTMMMEKPQILHSINRLCSVAET